MPYFVEEFVVFVVGASGVDSETVEAGAFLLHRGGAGDYPHDGKKYPGYLFSPVRFRRGGGMVIFAVERGHGHGHGYH